MNNAEKNSFRQKKIWKDFRLLKIQEVKSRDPKKKLRCELFGTLLKESSANCHHLDERAYTDLRLDKFKILSPTAHKFIEWVDKVLKGKSTVPNRDKWLELLGPFLPVSEKTVIEYKVSDCLQKSHENDTI